MTRHVIGQIPFLGETFATDCTRERPLACVNSDVAIKKRFGSEGFFTEQTSERPLPRVTSHVNR